MMPSTGTLFVVSTPIGNLDDFSPRGRAILNSVSYILCEDPMQTGKLGVMPPKYRYKGYGPGGLAQTQSVIGDLQTGKNVALVSDAGTPLVNDPGWFVIQEVVKLGLPVVHVPGPTAFVSAAVVSGLPCDRLLFLGFLPKKEGEIKKFLTAGRECLMLLDEPASISFYLAKYQIDRFLAATDVIFGPESRISIAREMTKLHEEHFTGTIEEAKNWFTGPHRHDGEFTVVMTITPAVEVESGR